MTRTAVGRLPGSGTGTSCHWRAVSPDAGAAVTADLGGAYVFEGDRAAAEALADALETATRARFEVVPETPTTIAPATMAAQPAAARFG